MSVAVDGGMKRIEDVVDSPRRRVNFCVNLPFSILLHHHPPPRNRCAVPTALVTFGYTVHRGSASDGPPPLLFIGTVNKYVKKIVRATSTPHTTTCLNGYFF